MRKSVYLYLLICMMVCCAESLKADNVYLQEMAVPDFSMADELFKPKVPLGKQGRRPSSYLNRSVRVNNPVVTDKKERYAYKSIGAGISIGGQTMASSGRVDERMYMAQIPAMGVFNMEEPLMDDMMLMASPPPGGGPGTGELVPLEDGVLELLLLLSVYCLWLRVRKRWLRYLNNDSKIVE